MSKLNHPGLAEYQDVIDSVLQHQGPSLQALESNPPQTILSLNTNHPTQFQTHRWSQEMVVRECRSDQDSNIRAVWVLILHQCFAQPSVRPLGQLLSVILNPQFRIQFPKVDTPTDPLLFNSLEFKKLLLHFLTIVDTQKSSLVEALSKYPIIDVVLIQILRTVANMHNNFAPDEVIPTNLLLESAHKCFGLEVTGQKGSLYLFNNNCALLDGLKVFVGYPASESLLEISRVGPETTFINTFKDCAMELTINKSSFWHDGQTRANPSNSESKNYIPLTGLLKSGFGRVASSQIFPSILQRTQHELLKSAAQNSTYNSNILQQTRQDSKILRSSYSIPNRIDKGDIKNQLKKSQMRLSVMKNKEDRNKRVSTADIFDNEQYFSGAPSRSTTNQGNIQGSRRQNMFASYISPFEEIVKRDSAVQRHPYFLGERPLQKHEPHSLSLTKPSPSYGINRPLFREVTSSYQSNPAAKIPSFHTPYSKTPHYSPALCESSLQSYYGDFTSSSILQHLPSHNKHQIQGIKRSLKGKAGMHI